MANRTVFAYPPKPARFFRVTDTKSAVQFGCYGMTKTNDNVGFDTGCSTQYISLGHRITRYSVKCHLEWSSLCEWGGLISVCSTQEKERKEVAWRSRDRRGNICVYEISTDDLHWTTLELTSDMRISALVNDEYNVPVYFIKAIELISVLGLHGRIKPEAEYGARDEWFALEWIPRDMIRARHHCN